MKKALPSEKKGGSGASPSINRQVACFEKKKGGGFAGAEGTQPPHPFPLGKELSPIRRGKPNQKGRKLPNTKGTDQVVGEKGIQVRRMEVVPPGPAKRTRGDYNPKKREGKRRVQLENSQLGKTPHFGRRARFELGGKKKNPEPVPSM